MSELKSHLLKALVLLTFTYGGGDLNSHWKVFEKGMKIHVMSRVKVRFLTTYHILWVEFGELPMELYTLKANYEFSTMACPPTLLLISQSSSPTFLSHL